MKNAVIIIIIVIVLIGVTFFLGRWSKSGAVNQQIERLTETNESLASRGQYLAEYIRSAERQNRELADIVDKLRAENQQALELLEGIGGDNSALIEGSESLESGLGNLADAIAGLIADITAGED